jgi:DNA polymerase I-like protein with 3'-5' exonuclease and polymerase domains
MCLRYPDIQAHKDEKGRTQYTYADGKKRKRLHAGVLANNVTQGTARVVMTDAMLRTSKKYDVVLTVHDEYAILVPEDRAEEGVALLRADLNKTPVWMPGIPLTSDVSYAKRYGLAK